MKLLDRIFAKRQTAPPREERSHVFAFSGAADSGVYVNEDTALGISTAWACGTLIARSIAMLPAHVMAPRGPLAEDGNERLTNHPVEDLLHREPNPETTPFRWRESEILAAVFHGNGYAEIERDNMGRPLALWPIHPSRVTVCRDQESGRLVYEIDNGTQSKAVLEPADMLHLAGPSLGGPVGMSLISYARHTLGLAISQERFASHFIRNQAAPSGILTVKSNIDKPGLERLRAQIKRILGGPRRAGEIGIFDAGTDWKQIGVAPQDAEFLAQRRFSTEEVCRWFGVPPQKIADTSKQTFANFEQANLSFLTDAILPWIVRFEQEANRKLIRRAIDGRGRPFVKLNANAIVRADLERRNRSYALGRQWGWLSVNDIRRLEDMEPIGPEGDEYLRPMNMQPIGETPPDESNVRELADAARRAS